MKLTKNPLIRTIYLYLFSLVGMFMLLFGAAQFVDVGLRTWVFTDADNRDYYEPVSPDGKEMILQTDFAKSERDRDMANASSLMLIGLPIWAYHWRIIKKDKDA